MENVGSLLHGFSVALWTGAGAAVVAALLALTLRQANELGPA